MWGGGVASRRNDERNGKGMLPLGGGDEWSKAVGEQLAMLTRITDAHAL